MFSYCVSISFPTQTMLVTWVVVLGCGGILLTHTAGKGRGTFHCGLRNVSISRHSVGLHCCIVCIYNKYGGHSWILLLLVVRQSKVTLGILIQEIFKINKKNWFQYFSEPYRSKRYFIKVGLHHLGNN